MQFGNRTFFISENVSDHYARRFAREISLRSGKTTADPGVHADYIIYDAEKDIAELEELASFVLNNASPGDLVITMGAGDIYKAAEMILEKDKAKNNK